MLFTNTVLFSQKHIVVFAREDVCILELADSCKRSVENEVSFYNAYKTSIVKVSSPKFQIDLVTPPLEWGRKVSDKTYGTLSHLSSFEDGFVTGLSLNNMLPNHNYRLCLNGRPDLEGNTLLPTPVKGNEKEKYYDFLTIKTDAQGEYHANLAILLKPGQYHVRFYVKDTDDFKIVLYHDYFRFNVQ